MKAKEDKALREIFRGYLEERVGAYDSQSDFARQSKVPASEISRALSGGPLSLGMLCRISINVGPSMPDMLRTIAKIIETKGAQQAPAPLPVPPPKGKTTKKTTPRLDALVDADAPDEAAESDRHQAVGVAGANASLHGALQPARQPTGTRPTRQNTRQRRG